MAEGTEVGKIHLGVEIDPELSEGDPKAQLAKISKILEKGLANLKGSFKLKGLEEAFEECFKSMNIVMKEQMEIMKASMRDFITSIKAMLEGTKLNLGSVSFDKPQSDSAPKETTSTANTARAPPKARIKMPKIDLSMSDQDQSTLLNQKILNSQELINAQKLQLKQYTDELSHLNDVNNEKSGMSKELSENIAKLKDLKTGIAKAKKRISEIDSMGSKTQGQSLVYLLEKEIKKVTSDITYLKSKLSDLGKIDSVSGISNLTIKISKLKGSITDSESYLKSMKSELDGLQGKMEETGASSQQMSSKNRILSSSIYQVNNALGTLLAQYGMFNMQSVKLLSSNAALSSSLSGNGAVFASLRGYINRYTNAISNAIRSTRMFQFTQSLMNNTAIGQGIQSVASRIAYLNGITVQAAKSHQLFGIVLNGLKTSRVGFMFTSLGSKLQSLKSGAGAVTSKLCNLALVGMNSASAGAIKLAGSLGRVGLNKFGNGLKLAGKHAVSFAGKLLGVRTASKKASNGMGRANMGLSRLIRSFVIFSLIFPLVSQGIRALGQSIGATLMTNDAFATSLDQIKSNLMAAFMPIYNAVLPALNALMSALANVTAHIATFVSSLFGTTYTSSINAAKGMVAAKDAMGAYGSAAKKAAKDANASVMAFDHLNKLNSKNDSDGSGGGAPNIIPTDIDTTGANSLAEKIKKMFADQDYEGIGKMIGEGINRGIAKVTEFIDWNNVGGKITAVIDGFSRIFNSAVATIDWNATGKMVGTGVNTLANTVKLFFEKINWELLGTSLSRGLNGIVHTVNWRNLGETIGSYFMARINGLYGFVKTADWPGIGKALADGVMGLVNYVNWGKFGTLVGTSIQGIISTVHKFVNNIDWRGLGSKIATSLNNFFSSINWGEFGLTLSDAAHGILNTLRKALADFDFIAIGQDIADFLCNIDWLGLLLDVGVIIGRAFIGLSATIMSGVSQLANNIVNGFFNGIIEFFGDPLGWIKEHIVDPFINAIKDLFGIHSPSTVMMEIGGYLIQGLLNGIGNLIPNLIGSVTSWFGDIGSKILQTWDNVKSWTMETWSNITTNISGKVSSIKEKISSGFNSAKDAVTTTCSRIKDGVTTKFGEITGWIGGLKDDLWSKATETFNRYLDGVKSVDLKSGVKGVMDGVVNTVKGITSQASTWGSDLMSGMASGIKSASSWVTNAVSGVASKVASWLHFSRPDVGPLREYEKWMPDMMMGLSKTLQSKAPVLLNTVKGIATSVSSTMQDIQPAVAFTGQTTIADQYNNNYISSDDMLISLLKEIIGLLKGNSKGGGTTSTQEIIVKIGDTEMARVVIAAIKKYEKETGRKVLVS